MGSLPRKNSEFLAMYRDDIEQIINPYGFVYEDRDEYYETGSFTAKEWKEEGSLYYKTMPYGKIYLRISSGGRLSKFDISADLRPAIQEVANIEQQVYGEIGIRDTDNIYRWHEGAEGVSFGLLEGTGVMRDTEQYRGVLKNIRDNLLKYLAMQTPRDIFEAKFNKCLAEHSYQDDFDFRNADTVRLGYWLIMAKLAGEDYYRQVADLYVELNRALLEKDYSIDIVKLKDFLDTYTPGQLA